MADRPTTIVAAHQALRNKSLSARELTQSYLDTIARRDGSIGAYIDVYRESALAEADIADQRFADGSATVLTGIPLALKDLIMVAGRRCTAGSKMLEHYSATYDATIVSKLKAAGAVLLGKTSLDEFAMGSSNENTEFSRTRNPWDTTRVPGGSSGGSAAAVAADECLAALGTDTGGSVRQPASFCGVVGLKPTYGRMSRHGVIAMTSSLDQIGPLTKTVADAALLFNALAGYDPLDATTGRDAAPVSMDALEQSVKGMAIGIPKEFFIEGMDPEVERGIAAACDTLKELGATLVEVSLPLTKYALAVYQLTVTSEVSSNLARYDGMRYGLSVREPGARLDDVYRQSRAQGFGSEVKRRVILGTFALSAGYQRRLYVQAQKVRSMISREFREVFAKVDALVSPTSPSVAFKQGEKQSDPLLMYLSDIYTVPANIGGICAISVPGGFAHGLPIGLQFMARQFDEATLFRLAHQYEQATTWHAQWPKLD